MSKDSKDKKRIKFLEEQSNTLVEHIAFWEGQHKLAQDECLRLIHEIQDLKDRLGIKERFILK